MSKLLCFLGIHKWKVTDGIVAQDTPNAFPWPETRTCKRCGKTMKYRFRRYGGEDGGGYWEWY
uniref:Uncharacterized protein n=1 Tax=viral metagenome TaxID=1070528 RepID=A0A6M3L6W3_9ZZZZ